MTNRTAIRIWLIELRLNAGVSLPIVLVLFLTFSLLSCNQKKQASLALATKADSSSATSSKQAFSNIAAAKKMLADGMLVTRSDNDFESLTLQNFNQRERSFSHSGIAFKEGDTFFIYHSMAGTENPTGACRRDPFDSFVSPIQKTGFGLFKYDLSARETNKFHQLLQEHYATQMPFDVSFDLNTDDSLYCSEMISKDLRKASGGRVQIPVSVINNFHPKIIGYKYNSRFYKTFRNVGIDDLYLNPFCKEITRVKY